MAIQTPISKILGTIIEQAVKSQASAIHIEPQNNRTLVLYEIKGTLRDVLSLPPDVHLDLVSHIKGIAHVEDKRRGYLEGGFHTTVEGGGENMIVCHVAIIETSRKDGEMVVIGVTNLSKIVIK